MSESRIFTYQTRLALTSEQASVLDAYAALHGGAERCLFAALQAGGSLNDLKRAFQTRFGITARQFNAIRVGLDGKIAAIKERRPELIAEADARMRRAAKVIAKLEARCPGTNKVHQKKRRLHILQARIAAQKADHAAGTVRLCFGSRRLFRAQFDLKANGYATHADWQAAWQQARSSQFFVLGSQDETAGNQTCQAVLAEDGALTLTLRLPEALAAGKHIALSGVRFAYGHGALVAALHTSHRIRTTTRAGTPTMKRVGSAISYRFVRDAKGWRVFASVEAAAVTVTTHRAAGAIGIDLNADHVAVAETDRFGNLIGTQRIPLVTYGKTHAQAKALIGDACVALVAQAKAAGKPLVIEALNFQKKKAELEAVDPKQARMLSSFACTQVSAGLTAAGFRAGVEVIDVNPAYTSVMGAVNHAQRLGISVHQAAAYAIARRGLRLSEAPAVREAIVPTRNGGHVTFALPARNRAKHVWSHWSKIRTRLTAAHAAHYRSGRSKDPPAPLPPAMRASGAIRYSTTNVRGASRQQHCSADADTLPW